MFVFGPLVYFYTASLVNRPLSKKWHHLVIPTLVFFLMIPFFFQSSPLKIAFLLNYNSGKGSLLGQFLYYAALIQTLFYFFLSFRKLYSYRKFIMDNFSNIGKIKLSWLFFFLSLGCFIYLSFLILNLIYIYGIPASYMDRSDIVLMFVYIFALGYRATSQGSLPHDSETEVSKSRASKSLLNGEFTEEEMDSLYEDLVKYIEKNESYLDPDLTLPVLAEKAGMRRNELSGLINSRSGGNFYALINKFRIEKSKKLLADPQMSSYKILDIAYAVGFNTKATFNGAFKKQTSMTPSEFRKFSKKG